MLVRVSHFHLDHAASVPYLTERTNFKGRIFATHPTKAVMKLLLSDYIRVRTGPWDVCAPGGWRDVTGLAQQVSGVDASRSDRLYTEKQLNACMNKIETADFLQTLVVDGIKFQFLNAGHVLGAAMIMVEIAGVRVLYTGDYSCEEDRHLMAAKPPTSRPPHVLIVEATYGVKVCAAVEAPIAARSWCPHSNTVAQTHMPRERRERQFTSAVESTVLRNGRCLIPVFALGRAQELLLILGAQATWPTSVLVMSVCLFMSVCSLMSVYWCLLTAHVWRRRGALACQAAVAVRADLLLLEAGERKPQGVPGALW